MKQKSAIKRNYKSQVFVLERGFLLGELKQPLPEKDSQLGENGMKLSSTKTPNRGFKVLDGHFGEAGSYGNDPVPAGH